MADRFEDLRTLLTVITAGGVNAAAAELGIAKSAVSRRLSDLEKRLGVALMDRSNRRFELTAVGSDYAKRARAVLTSLDELDASVEPRLERSAITLRASSAILTHVIVPALSAVREDLAGPQVLLHLSNGQGDEDDGASDVLIADHLPKGAREHRQLFTSTLVLCAAPSHLETHGTPQEQQDLDRHPAIATGLGEPEWLLGEHRRAMVDISLVSHDIDAAAAAAIAGLGLAQLPDFVAATALADERLVQVLVGHEPAPSHIQAIHRADAAPEVLRLIDAMASTFSRSGRSRRWSATQPGEDGG